MRSYRYFGIAILLACAALLFLLSALLFKGLLEAAFGILWMFAFLAGVFLLLFGGFFLFSAYGINEGSRYD